MTKIYDRLPSEQLNIDQTISLDKIVKQNDEATLIQKRIYALTLIILLLTLATLAIMLSDYFKINMSDKTNTKPQDKYSGSENKHNNP